MVRLGIVDRNGCVYFDSYDVKQCRVFLIEAGLGSSGLIWFSDKYKGAIFFNKGCWTAAYWNKDLKIDLADIKKQSEVATMRLLGLG